MKKHDYITIADLSREEIMYLISMAEEFEKHPNRELLKGKVVATLFLSLALAHVYHLKPLPIAWGRVSLASLTPK